MSKILNDDFSILKRALINQNLLSEEEINNLIDSERVMMKLTSEPKSMFYQIHDQDQQFRDDTTHGWIQWKGTDVCMDIYCKCSYHGHFDGDFFYSYECPKCKAKFAVGANIKFIELKDDDEINFFSNYKTCKLEED